MAVVLRVFIFPSNDLERLFPAIMQMKKEIIQSFFGNAECPETCL